MTECMHKIFQEIVTGEYQPQVLNIFQQYINEF